MGANTQLRDVSAGPFTAGPLSDITPLQCTANPTPEPHGRTSSRGPSHSLSSHSQSVTLKVLPLSRQFIATIGTFEATRFFLFTVLFSVLYSVYAQY